MNDELEKLLIIGIGQLMMRDTYPNVGQIVAKIRPLIEAHETAIRKQENARYMTKSYWYYPAGPDDPYIPIRQIRDRLASLKAQSNKESK